MMGLSQSVPRGGWAVRQSWEVRGHRATVLPAAQWQGAKADESGSAGGLLTQAARSSRSCGGRGRAAQGDGTFTALPLPARS